MRSRALNVGCPIAIRWRDFWLCLDGIAGWDERTGKRSNMRKEGWKSERRREGGKGYTSTKVRKIRLLLHSNSARCNARERLIRASHAARLLNVVTSRRGRASDEAFIHWISVSRRSTRLVEPRYTPRIRIRHRASMRRARDPDAREIVAAKASGKWTWICCVWEWRVEIGYRDLVSMATENAAIRGKCCEINASRLECKNARIWNNIIIDNVDVYVVLFCAMFCELNSASLKLVKFRELINRPIIFLINNKISTNNSQ